MAGATNATLCASPTAQPGEHLPDGLARTLEPERNRVGKRRALARAGGEDQCVEGDV